jgi:hypothetical protein
MVTIIRSKAKKQDEQYDSKFNLNKTLALAISNQIDEILQDKFNIFQFERDTYRNSLFVLMNYYYCFYNWGSLRIPEDKFMNLIYNVQKNYNQNPYHNAIHAADVTNTLYVMLERLEVKISSNYSSLETLLILFSGAIHDVDHPGNTNVFEINSRSMLALTYNDKSVLENYHLFIFFNFLINDNMNIFCNYDQAEVKNIRKIFIQNVIATDMLNHASDIKKLVANVTNPEFDKTKQENKEFIMTQLIHLSDISNGTKPLEIYDQWVDRLFTEFFGQGDKEKEIGLPISFLCDRDKTTIPESQVFFLNFFTLDLIKNLKLIYPKLEILQETLESNRAVWESRKGKTYEIRKWD